jgi:hypothetical protein
VTQTRFTVLDDTRGHPDLADQISAILHRVAPTVKEITDLPLPSEGVRFRLLTPKEWREEHRQNLHRVLARDIADLDLSPKQIDAARTGLKITGFVPALVWPMVLASTQEAADGQCETVIAPRALHHGGALADERVLLQVVAHELVHHLQDEARSGTVWKSFFLHQREILAPPRSVSTVLEGHATWADRQVTTRLFGTPADHRQARKSWRYRLHSSFPGIGRLGPSREGYEQGAQLIGHAMAAHGVGLVNRIWKDLSLLPTADEIADPEAWTLRIHPHP